ncbi:glycosyl hydrolase family 28-related protein [Aminobacter sp. P9b]|uniref:glycosyl hydrolase family 28-related protein n=1 Tax=Aminobacter sp. P9b TaxID=3133697 RepID=UPI00324FC312
MVDLASMIFRDFETDGVPASGKHKPNKSKIREWGAYLEGFITAFLAGGGLIFDTRANLFAALAHPANSQAWVIADPTVAYSGIYRKLGASGAGSWTRVADLPYSFIRLNDAGAGTANAIIATSSIPLPGSASAALLVMNVFEANSGPVTIAANGAPAKPLKTSAGNDLASGYLTANMMLSFIDEGANFRLLSDVASAAIQAVAEAAAGASIAAAGVAEGARDAAVAAAATFLVLDEDDFASNSATRPPSQQSVKAYVAANGGDIKEVATRTALKALDTTKDTSALLTEAGREGVFVWKAGNYSTQIATDTAEGVYVKANAVASASGSWVRVFSGPVSVEWFGAVLDGVTDCTAAINAAVILQGTLGGGGVWFPEGTALLSDSNPGAVNWDNNRAIYVGHSGVHLIGNGKKTKLLLANLADCHVIQMGQRVTSVVTVSDVKVSGFEIDGNKANLTPPTELSDHWSGVTVSSGCNRIQIEDMVIHDCQYYGIGMQRDNINNSSIKRCEIYNTNADGLDWKDDNDNTYGNVVEDVEVRNFGQHAAVLTGQAGIDLRSGVAATRLKVSGFAGVSASVGIRVQNGVPAATPNQPTSIRDFIVRGNNEANTQGVRVATRYAKLSAGYVKSIGGDAYNMSDGDARLSELIAEGCIDGFRFWQNAGASVEADVASMFGLIARSNSGTGIILDSVDEITILGADVRGNGLGYDIRAGSTLIRIIGGSCAGNTAAMVNNGVSTMVRNVSGLRTRAKVNQNVDIAATGIKSITFAHGLGVTPSLSDVRLTMVRNTNVGDWSAGFLWATAVDATNVSAQMRVLTASATGGATVTVTLDVDALAH